MARTIQATCYRLPTAGGGSTVKTCPRAAILGPGVFFRQLRIVARLRSPLIAPASELSRDHLPPESLWWAMRTRGVMSLANNLGLVLAEQGDRVFA